LSYCPPSSLPAHVLAWLAARLARLLPSRPPGTGGIPPLSLEVRLDAVAAVILDGLSYRRAGRMVGISKTEVGDSLDLLLGPLAGVGCCQPDGTFVTTLDELRELLVEMATAGEVVVVDGLATRVQRPASWANQKVLYDAKRHAHTAQGLALSTIHGDVLWVDGGWPGSCHEHELIELSGLGEVLDDVEVPSLLDRGFRGMAKGREHWHAPVGDRRTIDRLTEQQRAYNRLQAGCARWSSSRSPTWPTPGHCAAGAGCCTASGPSTGPPAHLSASAAGGTESPHDNSITDTLQ
jgi:DDE superfamily endonuclease